MATMTVARCPKCQIEVGSTWRWCLACGYDPDGSAQRVRQAAIEARQREGGWIPVLIVLLGLLVGGAVLWRTTPDDTAPTGSASTAAEVDEWVAFTPPSGGFRVDMPAEPVSSPASEQFKAGRIIGTYAVGAGDHLFSVSVLETGRTDLTRGNDPALESALRGYVDELAAAVSGDVTEAALDLGGDLPRVDFRIEHAATGELRGRAVLLGPRLASAMVSSRALNPDIADHVVQSLVAV
jgi:hypothetical protein